MPSPIAPMAQAKISVCIDDISPRGNGRVRVRAIIASIFCSTRQLIAAAAPATSAIPNVPKTTADAGGNPGAARNIPITAVNTISDTTRGLVNAKNWRARRKRPWVRARVVIGETWNASSSKGREIRDWVEVASRTIDEDFTTRHRSTDSRIQVVQSETQ